MAQGYGIYQNNAEFEIAKYASSINISAGFHAGDPINIQKALCFAKDHNVSLGAHIGYCDIQGFGRREMKLDEDELSALIIYQVGALISFGKTSDLIFEHVRCHGALKNLLNTDETAAKTIACAIKRINPWLNLFVQNIETKQIVQNVGIKAALEYEFDSQSDMEKIKQLQYVPQTIHFRSLEDIKRAHEVINPTPINYNRVQSQI